MPRARPPDYHRTWRAATFYNKTPLTTESPSLLKITERISRDTAVICINARLPVSANDRVLPDVSPCVTRTSVSATKSSAHELAVQMRRVKTFIVNLAIERERERGEGTDVLELQALLERGLTSSSRGETARRRLGNRSVMVIRAAAPDR